jgi:hypothetical protein
MEHAVGWRWFAAWGLAGGLVFFALLTGLSIGFLVVPFALLALWFVVRNRAGWPEILGALVGAGGVCLAVAARSWDYNPCSDKPVRLPAGTTSYSCGGMDPIPWLIAGIVLTVAGLAAYTLARRFGPRQIRLGKPLSTGEQVFLVIVLLYAILSLTVLLGVGTSSSGSGSGSIEVEAPRTVSEP